MYVRNGIWRQWEAYDVSHHSKSARSLQHCTAPRPPSLTRSCLPLFSTRVQCNDVDSVHNDYVGFSSSSPELDDEAVCCGAVGC